MRKVMLLAAMLAMVLAVAAPAFAQANAVQYDGDDTTSTFCNQVQNVSGITQAQYGDANAAATDESVAIAEAANELGVSQEQVLNCFVGNEDVEDVNLGGGTGGSTVGVGDVDDDGDGVVDEEFDVVPVDGVDNDEDGVVDEADGTEEEAVAVAASASATAEASASAEAEGSASAAAEEEASASAAAEGELPETGGASLLALGAGALLVAGGLVARRIVR